MKGRILVVALLILTAGMIYVFVYLGNHDRVAEVVDVNKLRLHRGRIAYLLGVQATAKWDSVHTPEMPEGERVWQIVEVDTPLVREIEKKVDSDRIDLKYVKFEPDSSSQDLHAYIYLPDGTFLNEWVIENGIAKVDPNVDHPMKDEFMALQQQAERDKKGIWAQPEPVEMAPDSSGMMMPAAKNKPREVQ